MPDLDEIARYNFSILGSKKVLEKTLVQILSYLVPTYMCFSGLLRVTKNFVF